MNTRATRNSDHSLRHPGADCAHGHARHRHEEVANSDAETGQGVGHGCRSGGCCTSATAATVRVPFAGGGRPPEGASRVRYRISGMDCPVEERLIRNRLEPMPGIARLDFNLLERELTVYHALADTRAITAALEKLAMDPEPLDDGASLSAAPPGLTARGKVLLALGGCAAVAAELVAWATGDDQSWPVVLLSTLAILTAGIPTLKKGWIALRNLTLNISFLMSLAVAGAMVTGTWPEAAMVLFLFAVAEAIEALSLERVRRAIASLSTLAPETAEVRIDNDWRELPAAHVAVGSRIRVRTGSRVPLDSLVESGRACLDQAPITGESLPVDRQLGDPLYAGSIVTDGVVEARVTALAGDSTLARIASAIQEAHAQRAPTQRFVDRFARYYTPAVVVFALMVAVAGPLIFGGTWDSWLYQALVMLVIACPCALVLSTPVTVVSGLTAAARHGILIKGGAYLEGGRLVRAVALDKTGTLTRGAPELTDARSLGNMPVERALLIAASLDEQSTHPIAKALVAGWRKQQPDAGLLAVESFGVLNGQGVRGAIGGRIYHLGNRRHAAELGCSSPELEAELVRLEHEGKTTAVLCDDSGAIALFGLADTVRPESKRAMAALKALAIEPVMLTGDNSATAGVIAAQVGIRDVRANLLPEGKLAIVAELKERFGMVAMVGDGVNDAPALARADIGIAMAAVGSATALETADVAIMDDDPRKVADFVRLSRRCASILKQNITLALGIKALFLALALGGQATLWMAVFADMGASLLVVGNGLRLLGHFSRPGHGYGRDPRST